MENKMSNIDRNLEVIENLRKSGKKNDIVYAYAFGMAWAWLTDEARAQVIKTAENLAKESEKN